MRAGGVSEPCSRGVQLMWRTATRYSVIPSGSCQERFEPASRCRWSVTFRVRCGKKPHTMGWSLGPPLRTTTQAGHQCNRR